MIKVLAEIIKLKIENNRKMIETKGWFFEKVNERLKKMKTTKIQVNIIKHEHRDFTTEHVSVKEKIREHYKQL